LKGIEDFNLEHLHPTQRAEVECVGYLVLNGQLENKGSSGLRIETNIHHHHHYQQVHQIFNLNQVSEQQQQPTFDIVFTSQTDKLLYIENNCTEDPTLHLQTLMAPDEM
jgi:hypothetical protein